MKDQSFAAWISSSTDQVARGAGVLHVGWFTDAQVVNEVNDAEHVENEWVDVLHPDRDPVLFGMPVEGDERRHSGCVEERHLGGVDIDVTNLVGLDHFEHNDVKVRRAGHVYFASNSDHKLRAIV
ncbi:hypothetical protein OWR29_37695 [Actinoplanes sp. Pm04-4]|uniref:Uncharacterized protein n=1 Tax=Paractinoplanes pyxinae TaxID=2997416 RepID=A0ABT4BB71_9ACTN|nr:hypothetical protein [Actinoplanes pyxinae]MCY1143768.1 hypothetical protein [Actinoplanes pyxinae]